jgi:hypothetical protein
VRDKLAPSAVLASNNINRFSTVRPTRPRLAPRPLAAPTHTGRSSRSAFFAGWRTIWTSSGVGNTAIWIKRDTAAPAGR